MEFLKNLLKWILLILFIIIIIVLTIKFANRKDNTKTKSKEPTVNIVEKKKKKNVETVESVEAEKKDEEDKDEALIEINKQESTQETLIVDSPDTASSGAKEIVFGIMFLGFAISYIYTYKNMKENS